MGRKAICAHQQSAPGRQSIGSPHWLQRSRGAVPSIA
jgi:hypothetical protein